MMSAISLDRQPITSAFQRGSLGPEPWPMDALFDTERRRAVRSVLAANAYRDDRIRLADPDLNGARWLIATPRGLFAVGPDSAWLVVHGWFFGLCRADKDLYLFENCALREREKPLGRLLHLRISGSRMIDARVLAKGLDANCHQVRILDDLIYVVDTANQRLLRFARNGAAFDRRQLFPHAEPTDQSGAYLHINSVAKIAERIAVLLHNGKARPERSSEIAWFDADWSLSGREPIAGFGCHDLTTDPDGSTWYCASMSGEIAALDGRRVKVSDGLMTRGLAFAQGQIAVGVSSFGERQVRDGMGGAVVFLDAAFRQIGKVALDGPPTDIVAL